MSEPARGECDLDGGGWPTCLEPLKCWGPGSHSSGFESHPHPSLARTPSSLGLSSHTSKTTRPFSPSQMWGREKSSIVCKAPMTVRGGRP